MPQQGIDAYLLWRQEKTQQAFIEAAENEYSHYGDGVSLRERKTQPIMAKNQTSMGYFVSLTGTVTELDAVYRTI